MEDKGEGDVTPFYVNMNVHDSILHNAMIDSGASHNLMPKVIMDSLNLEITRPYKDLYSFESKRVKFLGMIKHLVVTLTKYQPKLLSWMWWWMISHQLLACCSQGHGQPD